jgi:hypothetical protein
LYRELGEFSTLILTSKSGTPELAVISELLMMIMHVSPGDLQNFAGKSGVEESRRVAALLEGGWATGSEARYAAWHAGQVLHHARRLPPTLLRDFNAIAVYFASLALWVYGLLSYQTSNSYAESGQDQVHAGAGISSPYVLLDGDENRETKAFLQLGRGVPCLTLTAVRDVSSGTVGADVGVAAESLSNPGTVLSIARNLLRGNFPIKTEPLPPLVESLENLLRDLGSCGGAGQAGVEGLDGGAA